MDKELKKQWVEALRSGRYKQGKRYMRTLSDEYTPIGIFADAVLNLPKTLEKSLDGFEKDVYRFCDCCDMTLPPKLVNELGIPVDALHGLYAMNEGGFIGGRWEKYYKNPQTFDYIANWIETNL